MTKANEYGARITLEMPIAECLLIAARMGCNAQLWVDVFNGSWIELKWNDGSDMTLCLD